MRNLTIICILALIVSFMAADVLAGPSDAKEGVSIEPSPEAMDPSQAKNLPEKPSSDEFQPVYPPTGDIGEEGFLWMPGSEKAVGSRVLALNDCIKFALERNQKLIAAGYDVDAAQGQLTEAKAQFWPVVEYKYRMAPVPKNVDNAFNEFFEGNVTFFNSIHVGIGAPITTFGQLQQVKRMAEGGVAAARIKKVGAEYDVIFDVKKIYYGVLLANETINLLGDAIEKMDNRIDSEEKKVDKEMDPYDLLQLKVFKAELERRLAETRQNLELAYSALKVQLDLDPEEGIRLDTNQLRPLLHVLDGKKEYQDVASAHQPNSKLLDIGVEVKRRQYLLEKYKLLPRAGVGFFVDVGRSVGYISGLQLTDDFNDPFNYTRAGFGLEVSGNLDFHSSYAKIRKARAEYFKASYERQIARRGLGVEVENAHLTAKRMQDDVTRAKKVESMAHQMLFLSKMNLDMGIGDNQKYADALKLLLVNRGQYFKTVYDYNMALAELERKVGSEQYKDLITIPSISESEMFNTGDVDVQFEEDAVDMEGYENEDKPYQ